MEATHDLLTGLAPVFAAQSLLFRGLDKDAYKSQREYFEEHVSTHQMYTSLLGEFHSDVACWSGTAFLYNAKVGLHKDRVDGKAAMASMTTYGDYTGGLLLISELGLRFQYHPGTVVYIMAKNLYHEVTHFRGRRISTVQFHHTNLAAAE